jgi:hypothetical protein
VLGRPGGGEDAGDASVGARGAGFEQSGPALTTEGLADVLVGRPRRPPGAGDGRPMLASCRALLRSASSRFSRQTWWSCRTARAGGIPSSARKRYHSATAVAVSSAR